MTSIVRGFAPAFPVLQQGEGIGVGADYLPVDPSAVLWGRLPRTGAPPPAPKPPGATHRIDTGRDEGIL
ncbi:hypothetical protein ACFXO7_37090 [Nocardia tengchongensis]|uniref:hypothetical protein n=1 Tax=Nocardia tengchongensis TaxID=2055889 RepID=UPI0036C20627